MKVTDLPDTIESLEFEAGPDRTPGLHVSEIIQSLQAELDPARYATGRFAPATSKLYMQIGFSIERLIEAQFAARRVDVIRPGEYEVDGILLSPDGIMLEDGADDEIKCTWKSSYDAPMSTKFWGWRVQMMAYCRALETEVARLRAVFVNGDYRERIPVYKAWQFEFTRQEIEDNWSMLLKHARSKGMLP